jgi:hypothetical protein
MLGGTRCDVKFLTLHLQNVHKGLEHVQQPLLPASGARFLKYVQTADTSMEHLTCLAASGTASSPGPSIDVKKH